MLRLVPVKAKRLVVTIKAKKASKGKKATKATHEDELIAARQDDGRLPDRLPGTHRPGEDAVVIECDSTVAAACPGLTNGPGSRGSPTTTCSSTASIPGDSESPYPQMTGKDLNLSGTQADVDPTTRRADRDDAVHGHGEQALPPDHARRGDPRPDARKQRLPELRDRARRPALLVPDDRLHQVRRRDRPDRDRRRDHRPAVAERGRRTSHSCSRRVRCRSSSSRSSAPTSPPRSARTRCARRATPRSPA